MPYSSSLIDKEWRITRVLVPKKKLTKPPIWSKRDILDSVFYQLKNRCNWFGLSRDLPPYLTVLALQVREQVKKQSGQ
jgi:transposase